MLTGSQYAQQPRLYNSFEFTVVAIFEWLDSFCNDDGIRVSSIGVNDDSIAMGVWGIAPNININVNLH